MELETSYFEMSKQTKVEISSSNGCNYLLALDYSLFSPTYDLSFTITGDGFDVQFKPIGPVVGINCLKSIVNFEAVTHDGIRFRFRHMMFMGFIVREEMYFENEWHPITRLSLPSFDYIGLFIKEIGLGPEGKIIAELKDENHLTLALIVISYLWARGIYYDAY